MVDQEQHSTDSRVADYWDEHTDETFFGETYWLANPAINRRYQSKAAGGRKYGSWVDFSVQHFLGSRSLLDRILGRRKNSLPVDRVLSIGSGDGDGVLERHLASLSTAKLIEGIDLAPKRIEIAQREADEAGLSDTIRYSVCNVETTDFPGTDYDAIYFNSSLHHMSDLEGILSKCAAALKSDGYLFINEYIGPNRFALSDKEKEVLEKTFFEIPPCYRHSHADHDRGQMREHIYFPDPEEVARVDPSEAIHSAEIVAAVKRHFTIKEFNDCGGTLMQFLLHDIAGNFVERDPKSMQALQAIFDTEDKLVASGELSPHFAMIVARH